MATKSFLFNSVEVRLVPFRGQDVHPVTGIAFYVSNDGKYGVRVYPNGRKVLVNPNRVKWSGKHGRAEYHQFSHAWGQQICIQTSHAVYLAWRNKPIEPGMTIDHIDGCTTNNDYRNLRQVSNLVNNRDGAFLRKLKKVGIDPTQYSRWMILRYYRRMAKFKETHTAKEYKNLSVEQLKHILYL